MKRVFASAIGLALCAAPSLAFAAAYTFRAAGTVAEGSGVLSPGGPTGKASGDLLLLASASRTTADVPPAAPTGWVNILDTTATAVDSLVLYCRIADGSATDTPTLDWAGTSASVAQIAAWFGDVFTNCATIIAHSAVAGVNASTVDIPNPSLVITTADTLVIGVGKKVKTATSDGATVTSPAGLGTRIGFSWVAGASKTGFVWDFTQQTTATNINASIWNQSVEESQPYASLVVALKTQAACSGTPTITSISADDVLTATEAGFTVVGTNFCATQGTGAFVLQNATPTVKTQTCSVWSATSLTCSASGVGAGVVSGLQYGALTGKVTNSAALSGTRSVTVNPPAGTSSTNLTSVATLSFDTNDNPSRLFGDPLDLQATSQIAVQNAVGCTVGQITVNSDASLTINQACTAFDWDFSRDGLYVGTIGTINWAGAAPQEFGETIIDHVLAVGLAMTSYDLDNYFVQGDTALNAYALRQLGTATDSTVDVTPAVTLQTVWAVTDASPLLDDVGGWIRCGATGTPVRLKWANPVNNQIKVQDTRSCTNLDGIFTYANNAGSVTGITVGSGTGLVSGTPTVDATTTLLLHRVTDTAGLFAEVAVPFEIDVVTIPDVTQDNLTNATATLQSLNADFGVTSTINCSTAEASNEVLSQSSSSFLWGTTVALVAASGCRRFFTIGVHLGF